MDTATAPAHKSFSEKGVTEDSEYNILRLLIKNKDFAIKHIYNLKSTHFSPRLAPLFEVIQHHWKHYDTAPSNQAIVQALKFKIGTNLSTEKVDSICEVLCHMKEDGQDVEFTDDFLTKHIIISDTVNTLGLAVELLKKAKKNNDPSLLVGLGEKLAQAIAGPSIAAYDAETEPDIPPMPEEAMYGWLGDKAKELDCPLGVAYPSMLTIGAARGVPESSGVRPNLFTFLLGGIHTGKSVTMYRALKTLTLDDEMVKDITPSSDQGLFRLFGDEAKYGGKTVIIMVDELRNMMNKVNITGSSLAPTLCTLFYKDKTGSVDKTGEHNINVRLNLLGALKCKDGEDFKEGFGAQTTGGMADRCIFGYGDGFQYKYCKIEPENRTPTFCSISPDCFAKVNDWIKQGEDRGRLGELALRIALISSSLNLDHEVSPDAIAAALTFMEWQEQIRKFYKPSEAKTLYGTITETILSALGEAEGAVPKKWNTIYRNGNWGKWGCSSVARVRDSLVKEGIISHDKNSGKVLRLKD